MAIGRYTVERKLPSKDPENAEPTWVVVAGPLIGETLNVQGNEIVKGGGITRVVTHTIQFRYLRTVESSDRLRELLTGNVLDIESVVDVMNQHRFMQIVAVETGKQ